MRKRSEGFVLAWADPKSYQKCVQMRLWHIERGFPTPTWKIWMGTPSCAGEKEFKNLSNAPDTPRMSPVPSITSCFLPYPNLRFPHRETHSQGRSFPSEHCSSQSDTIQHCHSHMENTNPFCRHGWTCVKPHGTSPDSAFLSALQQLILLL